MKKHVLKNAAGQFYIGSDLDDGTAIWGSFKKAFQFQSKEDAEMVKRYEGGEAISADSLIAKQGMKIGDRVIKIASDYTNGRTGNIVEIDDAKGRARVAWQIGGRKLRTWCAFKTLGASVI